MEAGFPDTPAPNPIDFGREMFRTELNGARLADYLVLRVPAAHMGGESVLT